MKKSTRLILFICAMAMCVCFGYVLGESSSTPPDLPEVRYVETPKPAQTPELTRTPAPSPRVTMDETYVSRGNRKYPQSTPSPSPTPTKAEVRAELREILDRVKEENPVYYYAASRSSDKFHKLSCYYVDNILPENIIYFETREDALEAGKEPCSKCRP